MQNRLQAHRSVRFNLPHERFGVSERISGGATVSRLSYATQTDAWKFLHWRALDYVNAGYSVVWWDKQTWFEATCEGKPTAFCVLTEVL